MSGTIDQLNFEVILDDKEFTAKVKHDIELANKLNISLSRLLDVKKQIGKFNQDDVTNNRKAQQILVDSARAQEKITREKIKTEGVQKRINAQIERATKGYESQSRILNELKGYALGYLSIHGAGQLLSSLVRVTGEFELQKTTLAAMLGDLNTAEGVITRIQGLAVESPFQFKELTTYAKQLSAFSVPAQELYDTTKMLADVSAGLGVGMDRIVLAYGQVRSAAFLRGQEVRQFTEAGIPILDELAKQFTELEGRAVSTSEVFDKISKRLVPFEMVAKVFKDMTSEGGKFYNMQEVQAETLRGKISNLKDAYEVMLNEIGKGQSENLKGAVDWARRLMQNYEETGRTLVELVAAYGVYKTALIGITLATETFTLANHKLLSSLVSAGKWAASNPYVLLAAGITAAGYAIYKNITALEGYEKVHKSFVDTEKKYTEALSTEEVKLDTLYAKLRLAKEGTEEYEKAKKQIYTQYAGYISDLKEEGVEVGNLATLYDSLKIKVEEYTKAKFRSLAQSDLDQTFEQEVSAVRDRYKTLVSEIESIRENAGEEPLSAMDKEGLWQYITGDIATLWDMAENPDLKRIKGVLASKILPFGDIAKELQGDLKKIKSTYASDMQAIINLYGETSDELAKNDPFKVPLGGDGDGGKSPAQKAIEERIKSVQKLQDAYEKLMPYLNEVQMKSTLKTLFPNIDVAVIDSLDFETELNRLADKLEEFDKDAAQRLRDTVSKDVAGTIADSFKAVEQYKKMLDSWLGEDFNLSGKGINFDISKIISNLNTEYAKIDQKRKKALDLLNKAQMGDEEALAKVREIYGEEVWQKYLTNGKRVIEQLAREEKDAARQTANEKIRDLSSRYVKEKMTDKNINLTDFEDKTLKQTQTLVDRLKDLRDEVRIEIGNLMANVMSGNYEDGQMEKVNMLLKVLDELDIKIEDTGEEVEKKIFDRFIDTASAVATLGGEISELGNAIDNTKLADFGKDLQETAEGITGIAKAAEAKDTIALIANLVSLFLSKITKALTQTAELQRALTDATREYHETLLDIRREEYTTIFGTDEIGLAAENLKILREETERYNSVLDKFNNKKMLQKTPDGQGFYFGRRTLSDILGDISTEQGWELYKKNGELNIDAIEEYYNAYSDRLTKKQRKIVEELIASGNAVGEATKHSVDYMSSLFNGLADDIASTMVDAFIKTGDAATDLGDIVSNIAKEMVKDLIKTLYIMPILEELEKTYQDIDARTDLSEEQKAEMKISELESSLSLLQGKARQINKTAERFERFIGEDEDSATETLADGIKGLTEDTANLLASYLNAIRSDVSQMRAIQAFHLPIISQSMPTITEHLAKIQANTYNTAVNTAAMSAKLEDIRSTLDSVMTSDGGASAFRTYGV